MTNPSQKLTGERPGEGADFDYDEARHLVAYRFAAELARGKRVLDAGSGEGFGTKELAATAASVLGVDYDASVVASAARRWPLANLEFRRLDLSREGLGERFEVVTCFQLIEHLDDDRAFLARLCEHVEPGGLLVMTTPNRSQTPGENPYHVREYLPEEFRALLASSFEQVELLGTFGNDYVRAFDRSRAEAVARLLTFDPLGLRRLLPRSLTLWAFARAGRMVRRQAKAGTADPSRRIKVEDFHIGPGNLEEAVDLVAVCRC